MLYQNAEVETHVAVNPTNANNVVAFWQQDRWSDGGAHGNLAGYSLNGGQTWAFSAPAFSRCAGGVGGYAGDYERATDPWLSCGPNGRLHAISIGFDNSTARNAILAAFSDTGGATWSTPRIVRFDNPRAIGNNFNDKETLTADPFNANLVYATWQRIVSPSERASQKGYENAFALVLGGLLRTVHERRRVMGTGPGDLPRARPAHAGDRQPGRGPAGRDADQRVQHDPRHLEPAGAPADTPWRSCGRPTRA